MDISSFKHKFPHEYSMLGKTSEEKKFICEDLIQEAINQIRLENRNATKWEIDALSQAIAQILYGRYSYSILEVHLSTMNSNEIARPEHWWKEADDIDLDKLQYAFEYVKGVPPR